jgi:hypothetical protein
VLRCVTSLPELGSWQGGGAACVQAGGAAVSGLDHVDPADAGDGEGAR